MAGRRFSVVLSPDAGGTYMVTVPRLPECITWGRTEAEALRNAREAIRCCIEARRKLGRPMPRSRMRAPKILSIDVAA